MKVAEILRNSRNYKGLSQDELAELCGVSRRVIIRAETDGKVSLDNFFKISRVLDNDPVWEMVELYDTHK